MLVPDWFHKILVLFGLKRSDVHSQESQTAELEEKLRKLNSERAHEYDKLTTFEDRMQALSKLTTRRAQSDLFLLKEDVDRVFNKLGALNTSIRQIKAILRLQDSDRMGTDISLREQEFRRMIAKAEIADSIMETANESIADANSIKIDDPTAGSPSYSSNESIHATEASRFENEKKTDTVSENVSHTV